jgi:hypothetical protein
VQSVWTIEKMFPNANASNFLVTIDGDENWEITKWELTDPQPTKEEVETYWTQHQDEILKAKAPAPTEVEQLKEESTQMNLAIIDLYEILLGGS